MPDLDLIKQGEQVAGDRRGRILRKPRGANSGLAAAAVFAADLLQKQQPATGNDDLETGRGQVPIGLARFVLRRGEVEKGWARGSRALP